MQKVGQISLIKYSEESILEESKKKFEKDLLFQYFRVGEEQNTKKDSLILSAYLNYYQQEEEWIKEQLRKEGKTKRCKPHHSLKKHKHHCKDKCITQNNKHDVSSW